MNQAEHEDIALLRTAESRLRRLSPDRLRVADDFLAYLEEREENEATQELLTDARHRRIEGFDQAFRRAVQQVEAGDVVRFEDIRRDV